MKFNNKDVQEYIFPVDFNHRVTPVQALVCILLIFSTTHYTELLYSTATQLTSELSKINNKYSLCLPTLQQNFIHYFLPHCSYTLTTTLKSTLYNILTILQPTFEYPSNNPSFYVYPWSNQLCVASVFLLAHLSMMKIKTHVEQ